MRYDETEEKYVFSSGRIGRANCGIIGLSPDLEVSDGYDGGFDTTPPRWEYGNDAQPLTQAEREELADYMIAQWTAFKSNTHRRD